MLHVMLDTCVWLDLAADPRQRPLLDHLAAFQLLGHLKVVVPRLVVDEFNRNKDRITRETVKGISSQVQQVKEAVKVHETNARRRKALLQALEDLKHKGALAGSGAEDAILQVDLMFRNTKIVETTDMVRLAAADRALKLRAPCHDKKKNSIADAMILETYLELVRKGTGGDRFAFVTHNKHDFGDTDFRKPHPELAQHFTKIKSLYFGNLTELLSRIDPSYFAEIRYERAWQQEPRNMSELQSAEYTLARQVWYNRHKNLACEIAQGTHQVVPRAVWEQASGGDSRYSQNHTLQEIWEGALKSAARAERELGAENIGPWTDFEWGMINGKLSALRWVLGDEWDELYT